MVYRSELMILNCICNTRGHGVQDFVFTRHKYRESCCETKSLIHAPETTTSKSSLIIHVEYLCKSSAIRAPAFWEYPRYPMITNTIDLYGSFSFQVKPTLFGMVWLQIHESNKKTDLVSNVILTTTFLSNWKVPVPKMVPGMRKRWKSLIRSLCAHLMRCNN